MCPCSLDHQRTFFSTLPFVSILYSKHLYTILALLGLLILAGGTSGTAVGLVLGLAWWRAICEKEIFCIQSPVFLCANMFCSSSCTVIHFRTQRAFEIEGLFLLNAALFFELKNGFVNGVSASMAIYGDGKNW